MQILLGRGCKTIRGTEINFGRSKEATAQALYQSLHIFHRLSSMFSKLSSHLKLQFKGWGSEAWKLFQRSGSAEKKANILRESWSLIRKEYKRSSKERHLGVNDRNIHMLRKFFHWMRWCTLCILNMPKWSTLVCGELWVLTRGLHPAEGMANTRTTTRRGWEERQGASARKGLSSAGELTSDETSEASKKM